MIAENGQELGYVYGLEISPVSALDANNKTFLNFERPILALERTDQQVLTTHENLKGETRVSYDAILRPNVTLPFDGLTDDQIERIRALHFLGTDLYVVRLLAKERLLAMGSIVFEDPPASGTFKCIIPPNSYTLASKRRVAAGGPSLLTEIVVGAPLGAGDLVNAWRDTMLNKAANVFASYDDATETITLDNAKLAILGIVVTTGDRCWISFRSAGFLARILPGFGFAPTPGRPDVSRGAITFEGA